MYVLLHVLDWPNNVQRPARIGIRLIDNKRLVPRTVGLGESIPHSWGEHLSSCVQEDTAFH